MVAFFSDGRFVGIEAKTRRGRQDELQKLREEQITARGGIYLLVRSVDDLERGLVEHGIPVDVR